MGSPLTPKGGHGFSLGHICGKWIVANGSVVADLPCNGEGSPEERLALIELRSQETHLPEKRVTFVARS